MHANLNDNDTEDPLNGGQSVYKGQENDAPTSSFLKKVFFILDIQLSIVLVLHILFGNLLDSMLPDLWDNLYLTVDVIVFPFLLILVFQLFLGKRLKTSPILCLIAFLVRSVILYAVLRVLTPVQYFKQITLFFSLLLTLHLTFTGYIFTMGNNYRRRIVFLWMAIWMALATGFLYLLKDVLVPKIFTHTDISVTVVMTFLYGLYLIYETGFILNGILYQINRHQYVFAAFILQYDVIGFFFWLVKRCLPRETINRRN